jgi:hypothetical protein
MADDMFTVGASGSIGNLLTVATGAKSPSPSGHDGMVIFDGDASYANILNTPYRGYIVLDGEKAGACNWKLYNSAMGGNDFACYCQSMNHSKFTYIWVDKAASGFNASFTGTLEICYCTFTDIEQDAAIRNIVGNDGATSYGLSKIHHNTIQTNYNVVGGFGPDGIQVGDSNDIYDNTFYTAAGATNGAQHPDFLQTQGSYLRIYNNIFRNAIDSAIDVDLSNNWGECLNHFWVYNNIFTQDSSITRSSGVGSWPAAIRVYNFTGSAIDDVVICNNTFVDWMGDGTYTGWGININQQGSATVANTIVKNNLFLNVATASYYVINIAASSGAVAADWNVDYNLVNAGAHGVTTVEVDGAAYTQAHPRTGVPTFIAYTHTDPSNDYHLATADTAARGQGTDLSGYFTTDKDGVTRSAWDIGAYEYVNTANPWVMIYG